MTNDQDDQVVIPENNLFDGQQIAGILRSEGPIVNCVLLRASLDDTNEENGDETKKSSASSSIGTHNGDDDKKRDHQAHSNQNDDETTDEMNQDSISLFKERTIHAHLISEIQVDTTPRKSMVSQILGGPFTFLGQYEEEGIVVMVRRDSVSPVFVDDNDDDDNDDSTNEKVNQQGLYLNPHELQPPLHQCKVYGDILLMRVAANEDESDDDDNDATTIPTTKDTAMSDVTETKTDAPGTTNATNDASTTTNADTASTTTSTDNTTTTTDATDSTDSTVNATTSPTNATTSPTNATTQLSEKEAHPIEETQDDGTTPTPTPTTPSTGTSGTPTTNFSSNQEFFLDYTKEEYIKFASRNIPIPPDESSDDDDDNEGEEQDVNESDDDEHNNGDEDDDDYEEEFGSDEDEESCQIGMLNLLLGQILRKFREDNGRGPNTKELLSIRAALAEKLGIDSSLIPPVDDDDEDDEEEEDNEEEDGQVEPQDNSDDESDSRDNDKDDNTTSNDRSAKKRKKKRPLEDGNDSESSRVKRVKFSNKDDVKMIPSNLENMIDDSDDEDYEAGSGDDDNENENNPDSQHLECHNIDVP